ncbi:hypothetical protein N7492_004792 [Penicillium capsulatum]|uniref:L-serine ammonia-lyase n=1 Tax=Penicillium capsulatum TaxID=69766 RepID=A0A9W9I8B4_9EURO|nr:hypothetical protein N7492_004792 [Penicillium capsulatum]KAJ6136101.1 hypothetical protein N7512_001261 [Penicillium capsulatum]
MASQVSGNVKKPWIQTPLIESATLSKAAGWYGQSHSHHGLILTQNTVESFSSSNCSSHQAHSNPGSCIQHPSKQTYRYDNLDLTKLSGIGNLILSALTDLRNKNKRIHLYSSSGGNAGLAAVHAARDLDCACSVVVPLSTKPLMIAKLRDAGATAVIPYGASWFEADSYLRKEFIEKNDCEADVVNIYVPPFDDARIWDGAATMVDEIGGEMPPRDGDGFPADAIVCSVGGGGLLNGIVAGLGRYLQSHAPATGKDVCVVAAETQGADSLALALRMGGLSSLPAITSQATSLGALCVAEKTFLNAQSPPAGVRVSSMVGSDAEAARGIVRLADETRLQVELACGISLELAVAGRLKEVIPDFGPETRVVVIVCGGSHITAEMIAEYRQRINDGWK